MLTTNANAKNINHIHIFNYLTRNDWPVSSLLFFMQCKRLLTRKFCTWNCPPSRSMTMTFILIYWKKFAADNNEGLKLLFVKHFFKLATLSHKLLQTKTRTQSPGKDAQSALLRVIQFFQYLSFQYHCLCFYDIFVQLYKLQ